MGVLIHVRQLTLGAINLREHQQAYETRCSTPYTRVQYAQGGTHSPCCGDSQADHHCVRRFRYMLLDYSEMRLDHISPLARCTARHQNLIDLTSRLISIIEAIHLNGEPRTFKQERALDSVVIGFVQNDVLRVNKVLQPLRAGYNLEEGGNTEWSSYLKAALDVFENNVHKYELSPPTPLLIYNIKRQYKQRLPFIKPGTATFQIAKGIDALILPKSNLARNAIVQVASQFNFLESKTPHHSKITEYIKTIHKGPVHP
jgi:hypothetical protein